MAKISALDRRLISLLQKDAHRSSSALARDLGTSTATVRRRTKRLIKDNVMRIQAVLSPEKVGLRLAVVIAFDVAHERSKLVLRFLADQPEVTWVASCTGRFDVMALARFSSTEELAWFMQKRLPGLGGVLGSETFVCLHVEEMQNDARTRGGQVQGYCLKCRTSQDIMGARAITLKNGRPATRGVCPSCGAEMFRIGRARTPAVSSTSGRAKASVKSR